jgi:hypothetical protein
MTYTDLSEIDKQLFKENWLLLLGFPQPAPVYRGYIPLRVVAREFYYFEYDPRQEGQLSGQIAGGTGVNGITDQTFIVPTRISSQYLTGKPFNVWQIQDNSKMYQLFMGISPGAVRVFLEQPATVGQNELEIDRWAANRLEFGYIDGFDSPLLKPSARSELLVTPQIDFALGYSNPIPKAIDPLLLFYVNHLQVAVVNDLDLVMAMLQGKVPVAIRTVGGLTSYNYPADQVYGISPIPLGANKPTVAALLGQPQAPNTIGNTGGPALITRPFGYTGPGISR